MNVPNRLLTMSTSRADLINADHSAEVQIGDRHTHYYGDSQHVLWQAEKLDKALFNSVRDNDYARALQIHKKGPTLSADTCRDLGGMTALHWAVEHNNLDMAELLIEQCDAWVDIPKSTVLLDPDDKDNAAYRQFLAERQHTPLFSAILHQHKHGHNSEMVKYLIDQGCSLTKVVFCCINEMKTWRGHECRDMIDAIIRCAEGTAMESSSTFVKSSSSTPRTNPFGELIADMLSAKRPLRMESSNSNGKGIDWLWRQNQITIRGDIRSLNIMEAWMDRYLTLGSSQSRSHGALRILRLACSTLSPSQAVPALRPAISYYFDRIGFAASWIGYSIGAGQDVDLAISLLFVIVALRQSIPGAAEARQDFDQLRVRELWAVAGGRQYASELTLEAMFGESLGSSRMRKSSKDFNGSIDVKGVIEIERRDGMLSVLRGLFRESGYDLDEF